jgi:hypothetical protein
MRSRTSLASSCNVADHPIRAAASIINLAPERAHYCLRSSTEISMPPWRRHAGVDGVHFISGRRRLAAVVQYPQRAFQLRSIRTIK